MDIDLLAERSALSAQIISFPYANPELDPEKTMAQREICALLERAIDKLPRRSAASWSRDWSRA